MVFIIHCINFINFLNKSFLNLLLFKAVKIAVLTDETRNFKFKTMLSTMFPKKIKKQDVFSATVRDKYFVEKFQVIFKL